MKVEDVKWFHSIHLGDVITPGVKPLDILRMEADLYFQGDILKGKTMLDVGAWDGFMSFEAEKRGASRVVASDYFCWDGPGWGTQDGFNLVRKRTGSKVEALKADVFELDPAKHGIFDVVLMPGVIYHLTDPWGGIKRAADMAGEMLIVETATSMNTVHEPVMQYWVGDSLHGDPTNYWTPNEPCLRGMLTDMGFSRIETFIHNLGGGRLIARAWR